jgi:hypothetical protein
MAVDHAHDGRVALYKAAVFDPDAGSVRPRPDLADAEYRGD